VIGARLRARGRICALLVLVGIGTVRAAASTVVSPWKRSWTTLPS